MNWLVKFICGEFCRGQAEREFKVEVETIGRVRHKNLVRLLGYCAEGVHRYCIYFCTNLILLKQVCSRFCQNLVMNSCIYVAECLCMSM